MIGDLAGRLRTSLAQQERVLRSSLILNPVENVPFAEDLAVAAGLLHGLYNSDKVRTREERIATDHQFAGRGAAEVDSRRVYMAWAEALGAEDATLRFLSGLHAHIVLFMSMARMGDTVLVMPVEAGGHLSGKAILERLGLTTIDMVVNETGMLVDVDATLDRCEEQRPDFVLVDRSEGLVFEDFSWLADVAATAGVFDASQYLTNIVCGDHPNPFDWGYDLVLASIHKNFPGPQKALLATRRRDDAWKRILGGISTYVSNMHLTSTYAAGLTLARSEWLARYSRRMLRVALLLEDELHELGVPVVRRRRDLPPTHHVWIRERNRAQAFATYEMLERCLIMTNFRKLPYSLGHGLRLGTNSAVRLGLTENDVPRLAELIADVRHRGATTRLQREVRSFNEEIWSRN